MKKLPEPVSQKIHQLEWLIQTDPGLRGIHHIPGSNLCSFTRGHLLESTQFLADHPGCLVGIVTGFFIPGGNLPAPENDGPPGALFLARGLIRLGYSVVLITDSLCVEPLRQGLEFFNEKNIDLFEFPLEQTATIDKASSFKKKLNQFYQKYSEIKILISLERVGPCHTMESFLAQRTRPGTAEISTFEKQGPGGLAGKCLNMRGNSVSEFTAPLHELFEEKYRFAKGVFTIGIGDGGNEIGMGSIPWRVLSENILNGLGGKIACRIATDTTIVAGVSNWAGYALAAALFARQGKEKEYAAFFNENKESSLLQEYCRTKTVVDGVRGIPSLSVDGMDWSLHANVLGLIKDIIL